MDFMPSQILTVYIRCQQSGKTSPQAQTLQCQEGSENCVPISKLELTLIVPGFHPSPANSALGTQKKQNWKQSNSSGCSCWLSMQGTPLQSSWRFWQSRTPSWGSSLLGARWGAGLFTLHLRPNIWGNCNHLILPCWLQEESGYTTQGRVSSHSLPCVSPFFLPFPCLLFIPRPSYPPVLYSSLILFLSFLWTSKTKHFGGKLKTEVNPYF